MASAVRRTDRCAPARGRTRVVGPAGTVLAGPTGAPVRIAVGSGTGRAGCAGAAGSSAVAALDVASAGAAGSSAVVALDVASVSAAASARGGSSAGCFAVGAASVLDADDDAGVAPWLSGLEGDAAVARCGAVSGSSGVRVAGRDGTRDGGEPANGSPRPSVRVERGADLTVLRGRPDGDRCVGTERRAKPGAGARLPPDVDACTAVGDAGPGLGAAVVADPDSVVGPSAGSSDPGASVDGRRSSSIRPGGGAPSSRPERCGKGTTVIDRCDCPGSGRPVRCGAVAVAATWFGTLTPGRGLGSS